MKINCLQLTTTVYVLYAVIRYMHICFSILTPSIYLSHTQKSNSLSLSRDICFGI